MSVSAEEIRQAKKFLENKKISIKKVKPRLLAIVSKKINLDFQNIYDRIESAVDGAINSSNKKTD
jgi:hypothetical protein